MCGVSTADYCLTKSLYKPTASCNIHAVSQCRKDRYACHLFSSLSAVLTCLLAVVSLPQSLLTYHCQQFAPSSEWSNLKAKLCAVCFCRCGTQCTSLASWATPCLPLFITQGCGLRLCQVNHTPNPPHCEDECLEHMLHIAHRSLHHVAHS